MTSKEALEELKDNFENDVYKVERNLLNIIEKDLEVLEILKSSIVYEERQIEKHKFMNLFATIFGDDNINKIKEWLEK